MTFSPFFDKIDESIAVNCETEQTSIFLSKLRNNLLIMNDLIE